MSIPYETTGRTRQKGRTRAAMVAATRELLAEGVTPTVEQAADRAGISRTTAYRYFGNQRALLLACYPELEETSLLRVDAPSDPAARLELVLDSMARQIVEHEVELRAMLRLSLETPAVPRETLTLRKGRAIVWIEDALSPLKKHMKPAAVRRLVVAIRAAFGIEPLVWLVDIAGLSRKAAIETMRTTALTVLSAALANARASDPRRHPPR